jgi:hypothetical protein
MRTDQPTETRAQSAISADGTARNGAYLRPGGCVADLPVVAPIADRARPDGPVTTARLRRSVAAYAATVAAGSALARLAGDRRTARFGVGLAAPGAGFLAGGRPGAWAATQPAFGTSLALWLGSGNILAPLSVWLGTAVGSAAIDDDRSWPAARRVVPAVAAGVVAGGWALRERSFRRARRRREERNAHLAQVARRAQPAPVAAAQPAVPELSADELALSRFLLDRALQPVDRFEGFDNIEQFQTSSIRYQVTTIGHALSTLQYSRTPAFHGYLSEAQRNLIAKWQERICWAYWAKESVWGHLKYNPDPIPRDNIMTSGWLAYQMASYISNTGDRRYSQPASITFTHPRGQRYEYDFHSICRVLSRNFEASEFTLFPCEPNWIYALCNGYGVLPLPVHDRLYGTDYCERLLPRFRRHFEDEFMSVDGRTVGIRSSLTGFSIPAMTSVLSDCAVIWQFSPIFPDLARSLWEIVRKEWIHLPASGPVRMQLQGWDKIDTGNYKRVPATAFAAIRWAAVEMGDTELADRLAQDADAQLEPVTERGVRRYAKASVLSNAALFGAQAATPGAHRRRVSTGMPEAWMEGPVLHDARYPDVLVARAVSDGRNLELVLRPGSSAGRRRLGIARLRPGAAYTARGAVQDGVVASADGTAEIEVDLDGRLEVVLAPEA